MTIVLPFLSATLVNPPVLTYVVFPLRTKGLKSRCLGSISFSVIVGAVERVSIGDASRCALISMDSTLKSDLTVGPPIDFAVLKKDADNLSTLECLNVTDENYSKVCNQWSEGIFKVFDSFPRFDWEK